MAREVMDQLTKTGKISRGYIGAGIQDITPSLAKAFKLSDTRGAMIREVSPGSPSAKAGLQTGDVVTAVDNVPVLDSNSFRLRISRTAPGATVHLKVFRDGGTRDVAVTPMKRPGDPEKDDNAQPASTEGKPSVLKGLSIDDLSADVARQLRLAPNTTGVVVTDVESGSAAAEAGLRSGDVIQHVNRKPVANAQEFNQALRQAGNETVVFLVNRGGQTQFLAVEPR